jgi:uncharacterized protein
MTVHLLKLKRTLWASSLCLTIALFPLPYLALTVQDVSNPRQVYGGWVTDKAEILKPETETQLNQMLDRLEAKNGAEMAVVTVPETAPAASPKEFATKLFNYWGIGKKGKDNGVLFLISVKDRRVEIETGYGVEGILPDAKVGNIIETQITPRFKQRDFDGGTLAGTRTIILTIEPSLSKELAGTQYPLEKNAPDTNPVAKKPSPTLDIKWVQFWDFLGIMLPLGLSFSGILLFLWGIISGAGPGGGSGQDFGGGGSGGSFAGGSSDGGGSFGGGISGGGGSFGGGSSGGGGAGGDW